LARQHQLFILNNTTIEYDRRKKPAASVLAVFGGGDFLARASAPPQKSTKALNCTALVLIY